MEMKLEILFVLVSDVDRANISTRNWDFVWISTTSPTRTSGRYNSLPRFGGIDHLRQGDHFRPAGLDRPPGPGGG